MKILLASSEAKTEGGVRRELSEQNLFLEHLFAKRMDVINSYVDFIDKMSIEKLSAWIGLKNLERVSHYSNSLFDRALNKSILRYDGVAFRALDYPSLTKEQQVYIDSNVIVFSKLFGPIKADDFIPDYKFKQTSEIAGLDVVAHYRNNFSPSLDDYLGAEILDLRPAYFQKFYKPKNARVVALKFVKNGKTISHWAKHYRGFVLRSIALCGLVSLDGLEELKIPNLTLVKIENKQNSSLYIYEIE